jgi:hypothetical protein
MHATASRPLGEAQAGKLNHGPRAGDGRASDEAREMDPMGVGVMALVMIATAAWIALVAYLWRSDPSRKARNGGDHAV